jgi:hypothetical protein
MFSSIPLREYATLLLDDVDACFLSEKIFSVFYERTTFHIRGIQSKTY